MERMTEAERLRIDAELSELMEQHDDGSIDKAGRQRAHALFKRLLQAYLANALAGDASDLLQGDNREDNPTDSREAWEDDDALTA